MKKFAWTEKKHADYLENGLLRHLHKRRLQIITSEITDFLENASGKTTCVDLGCGDGVYIKSLVHLDNFKNIGCDADLTRLYRAQEAAGKNIRFVHCLAETAPFKKHSFDIVILHHVLEHVADDSELLKECARILKPGGIFILGVPNENSFVGKMSRFLQPSLYKKSEHVHYYSEKGISLLLKNSGFHIISLKRVGFLFPLYYIHIFLISRKLSFRFGDFITRIFKSTADSIIIVAKHASD